MKDATKEYAKQYVTFETERTRPVRDLVAAIPNMEVRTAVDLGCGPGNSTEVLAARYPRATITGVDKAPDMIEAALKRLPRLTFELGDIESWEPPAPCDVILANASLQWLPDHATLYPRLLSRLAAGGTLALQTPDTHNEPSHLLLKEVASQGSWAAKLAHSGRSPIQGARWYFDLLRRHCSRLDVWRTTYHHPLAGGSAAVVEWFKGSALRPYLSRLTPAEQRAFIDKYQSALGEAYPPLDDGTVLLPFPRLFIVATR
jgi:trans-aconitate 2-methyltransferase